MAAKTKRSDRKKGRRPPAAKPTGPQENRAAEAVTVAWMLTTMATLAAEVLALILWAVVWIYNRGHIPDGALALPALMLFIAAVTGTLCLLMAPLTYRVRAVPPPSGVTIMAVTVGAVPLVTILLLWINA
jgi:hypothetical protein